MPNIILPTLHKGQQEAFWTPGRNKVIRCGRRWGKSIFGAAWVSDGATKGLKCGWFAPNYKYLREAWAVVKKILEPIAVKTNESTYTIEVIGGGKVEFWTLEDENAGRSREYHRVVLDEIAFAKNSVIETWRRSIKPTMLTTRGRCLALSTPNGDDPDNFFWQLCNQREEHHFVEYYAPTWTNPIVPPEEIEELRKTESPLVFQQEYEAKFVDWKSSSFFKIEDMLVDDKAVPYPSKPEYIFAVLDTTAKGGEGNDGTAVIFFAVNRQFGDIDCWVLDWDIVEIEASLIETWIPNIFRKCEELARETKARSGVLGTFIEDKAAGMVLLQQGARKGWPVIPLDSKLTSLGKDARAMNVSGYIYQKRVKITEYAYDKTTVFKQKSKNHFLTQVFNFRINDINAARREDDLLDCLTYGVSIALGNDEGF